MLAILLGLTLPAPAEAGQALTLSDFASLVARCAPDVAATTLAAIARTESRFEPLAIHDNTSGVSGGAPSAEAAVSIASRLIAADHSVDLGLMQINSANLRALGLTVSEAFDACRSIRAGATILRADYRGGSTHAEQQAALRVAISRYNTGNPQRGFANGYVRKVEVAAREVVPAIDLALDKAAPQPPQNAPAPVARLPHGSAHAAGPEPSSSWLVWAADRPSGGSANVPSTTAGSNEGRAEIMADAGSGISAAVTYDNDPTQTK